MYLVLQVNYAGFPVEINGTPDLHQHCHIFGVTLKSHEDTLSCYDVLHVTGVAASAASSQTYIFKPQHSVFDRSWAFYHSTKQYIEKVNKPPKKWYESSSDEDTSPKADETSSQSLDGSETEGEDDDEDETPSEAAEAEKEDDADKGTEQASFLSCLPNLSDLL